MKLLQDARTCEQGKNCFMLSDHLNIAFCFVITLVLQSEIQVRFSGEEALSGRILPVITIFYFNEEEEEHSSCSVPCLLIT